MARKSSVINKNNLTVKIIVFVLLTLVLGISFIFQNNINSFIYSYLNPEFSSEIENSEVVFHFIDVGQADAMLVEMPDDKIMLVDAGSNGSEDKLTAYLDNFFLTRDDKVIDYFLITHQHEDHIGGADRVFEKYDVKLFLRPNIFTSAEIAIDNLTNVSVNDKKDFINMIEGFENENIESKLNLNLNMHTFSSDSNFKVEMFSPQDKTFEDENNYSPVIKFTYYGRSVMVTGDAEKDIEEYVANNYATSTLDVDILKAGHHGSSTSSTQDFLDATNPEFVIVSVGENNRYNLPNDDTLARLEYEVGENNVYRTDLNGNVLFGFDSDNLTGGKAEIIIQTVKSTFIPIVVEWWHIALTLEIIVFALLFLTKSQQKKLKKLRK